MTAARAFRAAALALVSLAVLDAVLVKLMLSRIDPVLLQYSIGPKPGEQHGFIVFSHEGILVWLSLVAIWAGILAALQGFPSRAVRLATAAGLFGVQSLVVLVFHPVLLLHILDGNGESGILRFLSRWDVLAEIYEHWGLSRNFHWVFACQLAGTLAVLAAAHTLKAKNESNDARSLAG